MGDFAERSNAGPESRTQESPNHLHQSVWMTHWMQSSRNATVDESNSFTLSLSTRPPKQIGEIETRRFDIMNESCIIARPEYKLIKPVEEVKTHAFFRESKPSEGNFRVSASDIVPYRYEMGQRPGPNISLNDQFGTSLTPYYRQNIPTLMPSQSSTRDPHEFRDHMKLTNFSGLRQLQLPHQHHTPGYYSVHDVVCTNVDSVVGLSSGYPRFSQTKQSLVISKKGEVNLGKGKEVIKDFGNAFLNLRTPSPFTPYVQQGVKIQSINSSADSEGKDNTVNNEASKAISKNESSAETDIMDMDALTEKDHISGVNSSASNKVLSHLTLFEGFEMDSKSSKFRTESSVTKTGLGRVKAKLPDMNLEFSALSPEENSKDGIEPSSSKTQSLDMDSTNNGNSSKLDPTERWIKRLKLSVSDSVGHGMQISNLEELSRKKNSILEHIEENSYGESLDKNREFLSWETAMNGREQSWIRRWLKNNGMGTPQKESDAVLLYDAERAKCELDDFKNKHFASIKAMALMGKAMKGFQPCQIEKRGSFVFWNTKEV